MGSLLKASVLEGFLALRVAVRQASVLEGEVRAGAGMAKHVHHDAERLGHLQPSRLHPILAPRRGC